MMTARPYFGTDYPTVEDWWIGHGWPAIPQGFLPTVGIVIEKEGKPVAAGWIKLESSTPMAMLEWCVSDPRASGRDVFAAISQLVESAKASAKAMGRTALFTYCKQESLARLYERGGFERSDSEMIHLVCNL